MPPRRRSPTLPTPDADRAGRDPARGRGGSRDDATVVVVGLRRTFAGAAPVVALDGLDLSVPAGELTAILGPSGSGKTTLLRVLAGTERADAGSVRVRGVLYDGAVDDDAGADGGRPGADRGAGRRSGRGDRRVHVAPERRRVGLVPQDGSLFPHLDVAGNVAFGLHPLRRRDRTARVAEMLELVGMGDLGARRPNELSGGQQQRVALARALAPAPDVVLLDEPFGALDASLRSDLRAEVAELLRSTGTTAVLVTHDQDEAMSVADHLAVMRSGRIVAHGPPEDVYRRPADLWVAEFLGDAVVLDGVMSEATAPDGLRRARCAFGDVPVALPAEAPPSPGPVRLLWRPEQVGRASAAGSDRFTGAGAGAGASVRATVLGARAVGPDLHVRLAVDGEEVVARWSSSTAPVAVGDEVEVELLATGMAFRSEG